MRSHKAPAATLRKWTSSSRQPDAISGRRCTIYSKAVAHATGGTTGVQKLRGDRSPAHRSATTARDINMNTLTRRVSAPRPSAWRPSRGHSWYPVIDAILGLLSG